MQIEPPLTGPCHKFSQTAVAWDKFTKGLISFIFGVNWQDFVQIGHSKMRLKGKIGITI